MEILTSQPMLKTKNLIKTKKSKESSHRSLLCSSPEITARATTHPLAGDHQALAGDH
jgi:hypothetical protein